MRITFATGIGIWYQLHPVIMQTGTFRVSIQLRLYTSWVPLISKSIIGIRSIKDASHHNIYSFWYKGNGTEMHNANITLRLWYHSLSMSAGKQCLAFVTSSCCFIHGVNCPPMLGRDLLANWKHLRLDGIGIADQHHPLTHGNDNDNVDDANELPGS